MAGYGVYIQTTLGPPDGRDIAFSMSMDNTSSVDEIQLDSVELIDPDGLTLIDAFTLDGDKLVASSIWVPPLPDPGLGDLADEIVANWELRIPLSQTVMKPNDFRHVFVQVRPEQNRTCVWAKGFRITYHEFGRKIIVDSSAARVAYFDDSNYNPCQDAEKYISDNPLPEK